MNEKNVIILRNEKRVTLALDNVKPAHVYAEENQSKNLNPAIVDKTSTDASKNIVNDPKHGPVLGPSSENSDVPVPGTSSETTVDPVPGPSKSKPIINYKTRYGRNVKQKFVSFSNM